MDKKKAGYFTILFVGILMILGNNSRCFAKDIYSGYPPRFDGNGVIDVFIPEKYSIIINDKSFQLSADTKYNRPKTLNCSVQWFKKNDYVYYLLEPGTRKIKSLWLVKDKNLKLEKP